MSTLRDMNAWREDNAERLARTRRSFRKVAVPAAAAEPTHGLTTLQVLRARGANTAAMAAIDRDCKRGGFSQYVR